MKTKWARSKSDVRLLFVMNDGQTQASHKLEPQYTLQLAECLRDYYFCNKFFPCLMVCELEQSSHRSNVGLVMSNCPLPMAWP